MQFHPASWTGARRPSLYESLKLVKLPLLTMTSLFAVGIAVGALAFSPTAGVEEPAGDLFSMNRLTVRTLLVRNGQVLAALASGAVLFGIPSLITTVINGIIIGVLVRDTLSQGVSVVEILLLLTPHGVFEISGLLVAGAVGLAVPAGLVRYLLDRRDQILLRGELLAYLQLLAVSGLLVVVGALVEVHVTESLYEAWNNWV